MNRYIPIDEFDEDGHYLEPSTLTHLLNRVIFLENKVEQLEEKIISLTHLLSNFTTRYKQREFQW